MGKAESFLYLQLISKLKGTNIFGISLAQDMRCTKSGMKNVLKNTAEICYPLTIPEYLHVDDSGNFLFFDVTHLICRGLHVQPTN